MVMNIEKFFKCGDPIISTILDRSMSNKEITIKDASELYQAAERDFYLIGMVANEIRKKLVGNEITYVINRNINFTNVCIKQCGFCAFSRDFRESQGYFLPIDEIIKRVKEAYYFGATEVCIQAGLSPDMDQNMYENICKAIKKAIPTMHIHGFSPEEILYGATRCNISIHEFLSRLKEAGVDTIPGTSAEILDQEIRDKISPGRITVKDWLDVIKTAHKLGIKSTATMMFGHIEKHIDRVKHIATIRKIQNETKGFTEFVPLNFIHTEAPMYKNDVHDGIKPGADVKDILLTCAISRIMLNNNINNIQVSWVKEGFAMSQMLLNWGANDFGGTLINESISTTAGSRYGQIVKPTDIRNMIWAINRIPVQRDTLYRTLNVFDKKSSTQKDMLDEVDDINKFGSYFELTKINKFKYKNKRNVKMKMVDNKS
ncbi:MAG: 5-amino-6-(D-ribitylamino)uracil--L-tyrosine 4-hydroxyphenyl transferase CofH [Nitrosopumilaceae archaeon]|nr:5-amino-6-(D-ribitylamino)uracil--L-tyrosine 4-hydroxyphenyl transferase CofH [Nitrosopumilaceae archaeon]